MSSSRRDSLDYAGESFDDAPETMNNQDSLHVAIPKPSSTRTLTDSPPVGMGMSPETTERPPLLSESQDETEGGETDKQDKKQNKKKNKKKNGKKDIQNDINDHLTDGVTAETTAASGGVDNLDGQSDTQKMTDVAEEHPSQQSALKIDHGPSESSPVDEANLANGRRDTQEGGEVPTQQEEASETQVTPRKSRNNEIGDDEKMDVLSDTMDTEGTPRQVTLQKSPLLTSHRLSTVSDLDEVNLANGKENASVDDHAPGSEPTSESPPVPPKDVASPQNSGFKGLAGSLPSLPWGASPANKNAPAPAPAAPRKHSGPFAWFSRSSTGAKEVKSPTQSPFGRRNPSNSVSTLASNPDLAARSHDADDADSSSVGSRKPRRNSLKDQFKMLRMREEGMLPENDEASVQSGRASATQSAASPPIPEEGEEGPLAVPAASTPGATTPGGTPTTIINPNLAPGTVSGFATSPTDASAPVDWDLWQQLVNNGPQALASSKELNAAIKRGIPQTIRGVIWQILADCRAPELEDTYRELVARGTPQEKDRHTPTSQLNGSAEKESTASSRSSIRSNQSGSGIQSNSVAPSPSQEVDPEKLAREQAAGDLKKAKDQAAALHKLEKTIRRDLGARTSYSRYFVSQGNQDSLFGLCKAYALYDEAVGYAQGMNFIVMSLLFNMDEVEAFELLVKLMNKYGLREMFIQDMPGLHRSLYQFERLLEDVEPAVYCHLRRRGVPPQLYATQWFLTLFAYRFPLQLVLRIYDLVFEEGLESTIIKFAVAIMRRNAQAILCIKDMSHLTTFLKERLFDAYIDKQPSASSILESGFFGSSGAADKEVYRADLLVQDACAVPLTQEMLNAYTAEWEEKVRTERERDAELEYLRHTVTTQSARVRLLEERAEASDKEHVQLASQLVHAKVENEELRDLNDALKQQVSDLKAVVDKQPGEVEEKLRTEMNRIMTRNIEVQNENRAMEEQMADMEKELVATKMKWAELSENHENLRQKWSDLRRALD